MRLMAIKTLEHYYITAGHIYDVEEGPTMTFEPSKSHIIIACDDGYSRKLSDKAVGLNLNNFIDIQQVREQKLKKLGIT
jgi:hypothetical protein